MHRGTFDNSANTNDSSAGRKGRVFVGFQKVFHRRLLGVMCLFDPSHDLIDLFDNFFLLFFCKVKLFTRFINGLFDELSDNLTKILVTRFG